MRRAILQVMEVTERDIAKISRHNIRVPREEFARVWRQGEARSRTQAERGVTDWFAGGVNVTCRWLARATVRPPDGGAWYMAYAPVTKRSIYAEPETIIPEILEAEKLYWRDPRPEWLVQRPGWAEGILLTFRWAWSRDCADPFEVTRSPAVG